MGSLNDLVSDIPPELEKCSTVFKGESWEVAESELVDKSPNFFADGINLISSIFRQ